MATESICPKGWTLPATKQIDLNRSKSEFTPVLGGYYINGSLDGKEQYGRYLGSEASTPAQRSQLVYNGTNLGTNVARRVQGNYIRCVSEEKTVLDLTYMQDCTAAV